MEINAVGILGAERGAAWLAVTAAACGLQVRVYDMFKESLKKTSASVEWRLAQLGKSALAANVEFVQDFGKLSGADLVIETPARSGEERGERLFKICEVLDKKCLLALCAGVERLELVSRELPAPERILGFSFARPVSKNLLAEVVRLDATSDATLACATDFLRRLGKTPVIVKDMPGLILERLRCPYHLASLRLLEVGKGLPAQIDAALKQTGGFARGPFESMDELGLDVDYETCKYIYESLDSPERLKPSASENRLVQYGQLGKKSSVGFYLYEDGEICGHNPDLSGVAPYLGIAPASAELIVGAVAQMVIAEAHAAATEGLLSEYDVDTAAKLGLGWPKGPFAMERDMTEVLENVRNDSKRDLWGEAV